MYVRQSAEDLEYSSNVRTFVLPPMSVDHWVASHRDHHCHGCSRRGRQTATLTAAHTHRASFRSVGSSASRRTKSTVLSMSNNKDLPGTGISLVGCLCRDQSSQD